MADWTKPTVTSNYVTFVDEIKNRDVDAITLQLNALTSPPTGSIRLLRSPVKFQEWNGSVFVDKVLSVEGGGTGLTTLSSLGTVMGLGSMAYQNTSTFSIGPGTIAGLSVSGALTYSGTGATFTSSTYHPIMVNAGAGGLYPIIIDGAPASPSHGLLVRAGLGNTSEYALQVLNRNTTVGGLYVRGDMACLIPSRLVIPVGTDLWATS